MSNYRCERAKDNPQKDHPKNKRPPCPPVFPAVGRPLDKSRPAETNPRRRAGLYYLVILLTTPEPTVRPPSRIAKRRPSSIAIGAISLTPIVTLSPGITIS